MAKSSNEKYRRKEAFIENGVNSFKEELAPMTGVELKAVLLKKFNTATDYSDKSKKRLTDLLVIKEGKRLFHEFDSSVEPLETPIEVTIAVAKEVEGEKAMNEAAPAEQPSEEVIASFHKTDLRLGFWYVTSGRFLLFVTELDLENGTVKTVGFDSDGNWLKEKQTTFQGAIGHDWAKAPITLVNKQLTKEIEVRGYAVGDTVNTSDEIGVVLGDRPSPINRYNAGAAIYVFEGAEVFYKGEWATIIQKAPMFSIGESVMFTESPTDDHPMWMPIMKKYEGRIGEVVSEQKDTIVVAYDTDADAWAFPKEIFVVVDSPELQEELKDSKTVKLQNKVLDAPELANGCPIHEEVFGEAPTEMETKFTLEYVSKADLVEQIQDLTGKKIKCNLFTTQAQLEERAIHEMSNKTELEVVCVLID